VHTIHDPGVLLIKKTLLFLPCLAIICCLGKVGFSSPPAPQMDARTFPRCPKLIVALVIDQFRYDYLMRFRRLFVDKGFKLLLDGGANFVDCRYNYASTATCPGHATLFTGAYSNMHRIVSNEWWDRAAHRTVYCAEDLNTKVVADATGPGATPGMSPHYLNGSTLGDELHAATNFKAKVVSISLKDRAAIMMGGHTADEAFWYDSGSGRFVSSTYYMQALPKWAAEFNDTHPAKKYCGTPWTALPETPAAGGQVLDHFDSEPNETCPDQRFLGWLEVTPYMTGIELSFAADAIKNEHLGQGPETDLLAVSLSVNDYIGHAYGPYSPQVADVTLRTDRWLADFFAQLDQTVGLDNVWITLSADHGVAPNPNFVQQHKLGIGSVQTARALTAAENALDQAYGPGPWIEGSDEFCLYLDLSGLKKHNVEPAAAEKVAAAAALTIPGIRAAYTRTQFLTGTLPESPLARKAANSFSPSRSGDVFLVLDAYAVSAVAEGTNHGTPWNYDAQVPLIFWGASFKPGAYAEPVQPVDLVPTLAAALGLTQPSDAQGRPLAEALK
jgi:predicted AlkP superfamily pyrophosphatase or phosphodiesterase